MDTAREPALNGGRAEGTELKYGRHKPLAASQLPSRDDAALPHRATYRAKNWVTKRAEVIVRAWTLIWGPG